MHIKRSWRLAALGVAGVLALAVARLGDANAITSPAHAHEPDAAQALPECPGHGWVTDSVWLRSPISESGPIADIPEFHDCQRFIVPGPGETLQYEALYAIFARYRLEEKSKIGSALGQPYLLATIVSWGGTYAPLSIRPGVSCLFLHRVDTLYTAYLHFNGTAGDNGTCPQVLSPQALAAAGVLTVRRTPFPAGLNAQTAPQVARWDWDDQHREQYIGIWCPTGWCEIGRTGFQPSFQPETAASNSLAPVLGYKGYYDRQLLAVADGNGIRPSDMMGMVVPNPELATRTPRSYRTLWNQPRFLPVAYMHVNSALYRDKFLRLTQGRTNVLYAGMRTVGGIAVFSGSIRSGDGGGGGIGYIRRDHSNVYDASGRLIEVPPTARWRWKKDDETVWFACLMGCCEACDPNDITCK